MAAAQPAERGDQGRQVEVAREPHAEGQVVGGRSPGPWTGGTTCAPGRTTAGRAPPRRRSDRPAGGSSRRGRPPRRGRGRPRPLSAPSAAARAGGERFVHRRRHAGHRRRLEHLVEGQVDGQLLAQARGHLGGEQRVPSEVVEVVAGAHPLDAEHLLPDPGDATLGLRGQLDRRDRRTLRRLRRRLLRRVHPRSRDRAGDDAGQCHGAGRVRLDPEAPVLERVGGKAGPPPAPPLVDAVPVDLGAGQPEPTEGGEEAGRVRHGLLGMAQRREHRRRTRRLLRQDRQGPPGADLDTDHLASGPREVAERRQAVGEADRRAELATPVLRVGGLAVGDRPAGDVREQRQRRRPQLEAADALHQPPGGRLHRRAVGAGRHAQTPVLDAVPRELSHQAVDRRRRPGDGRQLRPVDRRQLQAAAGALAQQRGERRLRQRHREHRPRRALPHQAAALGDHRQRVLETEDPGHAGGRELADRVAQERPGRDPPARPEPRQGDLDDEQRALADRLGVQQSTGLRVVRPGEEHTAERPAEPLLRPRLPRRIGGWAGEAVEDLQAAVDLGAQERLALVELPGHAGVLGPLAGKQEGHRRRHGARPAGGDAQRIGALEGVRRVREAGADHRPPRGERPAPNVEGVGDVGQLEGLGGGAGAIALPEPRRQPRRRPVEGGRRLGGEGQELPGADARLRAGVAANRRRLLQDDVGVGAAEAEGAHPRPPRLLARRPVGQLRGDVDRRGGEVELGVRGPVVEGRRDLAVLERQHRLDQPGHAGGDVQVTQVRLHRADGAEAAALGLGAERSGERLDLHRVAQGGAGAVGLDVADRLGGHAGHRQRLGDHRRLPLDARRGEADLERAVVVDRRAEDHRAYAVAVGQGVLQPAEHHHAGARGEDGARRLGVERPAVAVRRQDRVAHVAVAGALRDVDRHAAGERHVALLVEQRAGGQVDRHQRGGAGALDGVARPLQVELVGDPGRQGIAGVADDELQRIAAGDGPRRARQVVEQVGAERRAGVDPDRVAEALRVVAGVLERLPGELQEDPVLRVHDLRLAGVDAEEGGVETGVAVELRNRRHPRRIAQDLRADAELGELASLQVPDRFDPVPQVAPQRADVAGAGKAPGHAHDRDLGSRRSSLHASRPLPVVQQSSGRRHRRGAGPGSARQKENTVLARIWVPGTPAEKSNGTVSSVRSSRSSTTTKTSDPGL